MVELESSFKCLEQHACHPRVYARLLFRDSGVGLEAEMLPRVFEMFTRVGEENKQGGLGIGLSLVRSLVGLHGGSVEARSEGLGKGSEFVVRLPLADARQRGDAARPQASSLKVLADRHILVVDDNRDAAESLGMLLRLLGAAVTVVYDGQTGLEAFARQRPSLALLDIGMPSLSPGKLLWREGSLEEAGQRWTAVRSDRRDLN